MDFAGHTSGHSRGPDGHNLAPKLGLDGRLELASSPHLCNLHAVFVFSATVHRNEQITTGGPAKQRAIVPFIRKRTADNLKEHPSAASATTESDRKIEIVGCMSAHMDTILGLTVTFSDIFPPQEWRFSDTQKAKTNPWVYPNSRDQVRNA
jgi:hypothetical protein